MDDEIDSTNHFYQRNDQRRHLYESDVREYAGYDLQLKFQDREAENACVDEEDAEGRKQDTGQQQQKDLLRNKHFSSDSADLSLSQPTAMLEKVSEPDKQTSRDDWNEVATIALVDAWSKKCRQLNKSNLKLAHWAELADTVRVRSNTRKTDVQCKNRVDTLKKKYKHEKQKQAFGSISKWPYFSLLDNVLNSTPWHGGLPSTADVGQIKEINLHHPIEISNHSLNSTRTKKTHILIPTSALGGEGVFDEDAGSTKRMRKDDSYNKVVSTAIVKFGEMFEKLEKSKQQQLIDLEKTRKELSKDLERQRIKLFMQAQIELAKLKRGTVNFDKSVSKMNR